MSVPSEGGLCSEPLRSVENQPEFSGTQTEKSKPEAVKMNNNCAININIKTEPFTDYYGVEKEIGR